MPKTYNHLFEEIVSFPNLLAAYFEARRGKINEEVNSQLQTIYSY